MFCPNCGAANNAKQNYCRFCGLNLQDTVKSLTNQLIFGDESKLLKTLRTVKRILDVASMALIGLLFIGAVAYLLFGRGVGRDLLKISLSVFFLLKLVQEVIGYYRRHERRKIRTGHFEQNTAGQRESRATAKLLEEKPSAPGPSVVDHSTELLPIENKARRFE